MTVTQDEAVQTLIGTSAPRKEDARLLTGQASFVDDISIPGMVWMAVVRSPYAHARIRSVDLTKARAAEGVVAAFSGADLAGDWTGPLPMAWPVTEDINNPAHYPLATDKARYAGDGVAVVVAASRALAQDAAELVEVDYEPLPAVTDVEAALADGAPHRARRVRHEPLLHVAALPAARTSTGSSPRPTSPSRSATASSG